MKVGNLKVVSDLIKKVDKSLIKTWWSEFMTLVKKGNKSW